MLLSLSDVTELSASIKHFSLSEFKFYTKNSFTSDRLFNKRNIKSAVFNILAFLNVFYCCIMLILFSLSTILPKILNFYDFFFVFIRIVVYNYASAFIFRYTACIVALNIACIGLIQAYVIVLLIPCTEFLFLLFL